MVDDKLHGSHKNGYKLPQYVGIIYSDVKRKYFPTESQYITEKYAFRDAKIIASYLEKIHVKPHLFPGNEKLTEHLRRHKPEVVINLVNSVKGSEYLSSTVPGLLEMLDIPYTGADVLGESLSYNKFLTKKLLQNSGIPVPNFQLINTPTEMIDTTLRYPLISKLNEIHGAVEITKDSVSENEKHLRERLRFLIGTYKQPVLVEEFIVGKEIISYLFEGLNKKVYLAEKHFHKSEGKFVFSDFETQWLDSDINAITYHKYKDIILQEYIKRAFDVTKMSDYGKFDVRIDSSGRYFFLDANSNPFIGPKEIDSPMAHILELYGVSFVETLKRLLLNTVRDAAGKKLLPIPS